MKKILPLLVLIVSSVSLSSQEFEFKKGVITNKILVNDTLSETFALYLPSNFDASQKWPIVYVYDMKGRGKRALEVLEDAAGEEGYLLAASNAIHDSLPLSQNIAISQRMFNAVGSLFPVDMDRSYTAGFSEGARLANLVPVFIKEMAGVISCGASIANLDVLSRKNPFYFIGIVGTEDFSYPEMLGLQDELDRLGFPNNVLVFEGEHQWPSPEYLSMALEFFTLASMRKGLLERDSTYIAKTFGKNLNEANKLFTAGKPVLAVEMLDELEEVYEPLTDIAPLERTLKTIKRSNSFRPRSRERNAVFLREGLLKEDYAYYLEEDVLTYNYNNLGWWNYQMEELEKFHKSAKLSERQMGKRLKGFVNALVEDSIDLVKAQEKVDEEALGFLWMLKTITDPQDYEYYKKVISLSSKIEDYGTALFYLEELLKNGYRDKQGLYDMEHTALLRITPEFNQLVEKYLKGARYDIIIEE